MTDNANLMLTNPIPTAEEGLTEEETTLLARIPFLSGNKKKYAYLAYRSTGFTALQSAQLSNVSLQTVKNWRAGDSTFRKFESHELQHLQDTVGNDIIRFEFLRNMRMLLKGDMQLIFRSLHGVDELSPREFELFKNLRKFYTPADMLALEKVLHPEKHKDGPITIQLSWGSRSNSNITDNNYDDIEDAEVKLLDDDNESNVSTL